MSPDTFATTSSAAGIQVRGCPTADGVGECPKCVPYMKGWGTAKLTAEVAAGKTLPAALCGVLRERVESAGGTVEPPATKDRSKSNYRKAV